MVFYFSADGHRKFVGELSKLEEKMKELSIKMSEFFEDTGSWHDNFAYEDGSRSLNMQAERLKGLYKILNEGQIVDYPKEVNHVQLGSKVYFEIDGEKKQFSIVGYGESDLDTKKIAYNTPLAKELILKEPGNNYKIFINKKEKQVKIINVEPL